MRTKIPAAMSLMSAIALTATTCGIATSERQSQTPAPPPSATVTAQIPTQTASAARINPEETFAAAPDANLNCSLPVAWTQTTSQGGRVAQGAWITFPGGQLTLDPAGTMLSTDGPTPLETQTQPKLRGRDGPYYDRAAHRWVPSRVETISPDGSSYVYPKGNAGVNALYDITLVNALTGTETTVLANTPHWPIDLTVDTVYLNGTNWEWLDPGLWAADLKSGSERAITNEGGWLQISGGGAWGWRVAPGDRPIGHIGQPAYRLDRLDLATGQVTNWYRKDGSNVGLWGFNREGHPIVSIFGATSVEYYVLSSPGTLVRLFTHEGGFSSTEGDQRGLWLQDGRAIYLYNEAFGLKKVWWVTSPQTSESNWITALAGHCT